MHDPNDVDVLERLPKDLVLGVPSTPIRQSFQSNAEDGGGHQPTISSSASSRQILAQVEAVPVFTVDFHEPGSLGFRLIRTDSPVDIAGRKYAVFHDAYFDWQLFRHVSAFCMCPFAEPTRNSSKRCLLLHRYNSKVINVSGLAKARGVSSGMVIVEVNGISQENRGVAEVMQKLASAAKRRPLSIGFFDVAARRALRGGDDEAATESAQQEKHADSSAMPETVGSAAKISAAPATPALPSMTTETRQRMRRTLKKPHVQTNHTQS